MTFLNFLAANARWLAAGFLLALTSSFGQTYFISIFAGSIRSDFDLSHGAWGGIYLLGTSASAVVMVWAGGLVDHLRIRVLGATVLGLLALSCVAMAFVPNATALVFVIFALRFTGQGMTAHATTVSMARWFVATRGRALAIASLGFKSGEALLPFIFVSLMAYFAWQKLWLLAALLVLLAIPLLVTLLRYERTPQSLAKENQAVGMGGHHWRRKQVLGNPLFWFMLPALLGPPCFMTSFFFQQVHIVEIKGFTHLGFVALFPIFTLISAFSMVLTGVLIDRFSTPRILPFCLAPMALGFALAASGSTLTGMAVALGFLGLSQGASTVAFPALWAEFYGTKHLGSIKAMAAAIMVAASAIGPGLTGALIDMNIDFGQQMYGIALYFALACILVAAGMRWVKPFLAVPA
ncbi:MFS transporter [Halocynthiibacter sp. C4]|uniref:MFS transporter n=1 Tax=Halocynthiibacter sp. C4 TaxID=2992758 RepID=UPI00237B4E3C|nr:MFS transporter [Halocynthiibacter sp. C4]MDE0591014.1 MFS transporter [Halocynthiibacter sp. C4]